MYGPACQVLTLTVAVLQLVNGFRPTNKVTFSTRTRPLRLPHDTCSRRRVLTEPLNDSETSVDPDLIPDPINSNIPTTLRIRGHVGIPSRRDPIQMLDATMYETALLQTWDTNPGQYQKGFDWEIEKLRRYFAGLRLRDDGAWVKQPSFFDFLVNNAPRAQVQQQFYDVDRPPRPPSPVNTADTVRLVLINILSAVGFRSQLGMANIPNAVIQKYEGSFFSFIKGVLGGDLQTLAGGPLFLLLAKYFHTYGPIFNLSFGPKSFLVISDPVMSRHV
jgi:hypothetical protein